MLYFLDKKYCGRKKYSFTFTAYIRIAYSYYINFSGLGYNRHGVDPKYSPFISKLHKKAGGDYPGSVAYPHYPGRPTG